LNSLSTSSSSPSLSRVSKSHHYNLRPRSLPSGTPVHLAGLGLSIPNPASLPSQGRKSDLSKAMRHVGAEVISRRQSTLDGVLRALNTPSSIPP